MQGLATLQEKLNKINQRNSVSFIQESVSDVVQTMSDLSLHSGVLIG